MTTNGIIVWIYKIKYYSRSNCVKNFILFNYKYGFVNFVLEELVLRNFVQSKHCSISGGVESWQAGSRLQCTYGHCSFHRSITWLQVFVIDRWRQNMQAVVAEKTHRSADWHKLNQNIRITGEAQHNRAIFC